jgi:arginine/lysine/ornithine decarboxylase
MILILMSRSTEISTVGKSLAPGHLNKILKAVAEIESDAERIKKLAPVCEAELNAQRSSEAKKECDTQQTWRNKQDTQRYREYYESLLADRADASSKWT